MIAAKEYYTLHYYESLDLSIRLFLLVRAFI